MNDPSRLSLPSYERLNVVRCKCSTPMAGLYGLYDTMTQQGKLSPFEAFKEIEATTGNKLTACCRNSLFNAPTVPITQEPNYDIITGIKGVKMGDESRMGVVGKETIRHIGEGRTVKVLPYRVFNLTSGYLTRKPTQAEKTAIDSIGQYFMMYDEQFSDLHLQLYKEGATKGLPLVAWKQRKLLIMEIMFILRYTVGKTNEIVYVGGADDGAHLQVLSRMFPSYTIHAYGGKGGNSSPKLTFHKQNFDDKVAESYASRKVAFISDYTTYNRNGDKAIYQSDLMTQARWHQLMKPVEALLRFQPPYPDNNNVSAATGSTFANYNIEYLSGTLFFQPWSNASSTECRLVVKAGSRIYDTLKHEQAMAHHNTKVRPLLSKYHNPFVIRDGMNRPIASPELLNDYDSTYEAFTLAEYFDTTLPATSLTEGLSSDRRFIIYQKNVLALSAEITKALGGGKSLSQFRNDAAVVAPVVEKKYTIGSRMSLGNKFGVPIGEDNKDTQLPAEFLTALSTPTKGLQISEEPSVPGSVGWKPAVISAAANLPTRLKIDYKTLCTTAKSGYSSLMPWHIEQVAASYDAIVPKDVKIIVDGTAHIGVDSLNFGNIFPDANIVSVEIDAEVFKCLEYNIQRLGKRATAVNKNLLEWVRDNKSPIDLIFLDPPWPEDYNSKLANGQSVSLNIGGVDIGVIIKAGISAVKIIIVKVPANFDYNSLSDIKDGWTRVDIVKDSARTLVKGNIYYSLLFFGDRLIRTPNWVPTPSVPTPSAISNLFGPPPTISAMPVAPSMGLFGAPVSFPVMPSGGLFGGTSSTPININTFASK